MAEVAAAPGYVSRSRPGLLDLPPEILLKILKLLWEDNVLEFVRSGAPLACRRLRQLSQDCFSWEEVRAKFGDGERFKEWCKEKDKLRDYRESKERYATLVLCIFFFHIFCVFYRKHQWVDWITEEMELLGRHLRPETRSLHLSMRSCREFGLKNEFPDKPCVDHEWLSIVLPAKGRCQDLERLRLTGLSFRPTEFTCQKIRSLSHDTTSSFATASENLGRLRFLEELEIRRGPEGNFVQDLGWAQIRSAVEGLWRRFVHCRFDSFLLAYDSPKAINGN